MYYCVCITFINIVRRPLFRASARDNFCKALVVHPFACDTLRSALRTDSTSFSPRRKLWDFFDCIFPELIARTTKGEFNIAFRPSGRRDNMRIIVFKSSLQMLPATSVMLRGAVWEYFFESEPLLSCLYIHTYMRAS